MDVVARYRSVPTTAWWWLVVAVLATLVDAASSWVLLQDGRFVEANPWLAALARDHGASFAMAVRTVVGVGLLGALAATLPFSRLALPGLRVVTVVLASVVLWHVVLHLVAVPLL